MPATADQYNKVRNRLIDCFGSDPRFITMFKLDRVLTDVFVHIGSSISNDDLVEKVKETAQDATVVTNTQAGMEVQFLPDYVIERCYSSFKAAN